MSMIVGWAQRSGPAGSSGTRPFERWVPYLPPLFVTVLFLPSLLQPGIVHPPLPHLNDATRQLLLWREFWRDEVLAGALPLWNPFLFLGVPFLGEIQSAVFYPLNLLFLALASDLAFKVHLLLSLLVAAVFFYRLCRSLGASRDGAALGALAFAANGQFMLFVFAGWLNHLSVASWTPAVLWAFLEAERGGPRRRGRYLALGAVLLALQALAGHPEWMFYTVIAAMALALGRSRTLSSIGGASVGRPWLSLGAMMALAGLLSGPQMVPAIEAVLQSSRGQDALSRMAVASTGMVPAAFLPAIVVPRLFGPWDFSVSVDAWLLKWLGVHVSIGDCLMYVGLVPLLLAALGGGFRSRLVSARVWVVLGLVALALALNFAWLWSAVSWLLPLARVFRSPARFVFLLAFSLCVLASFGATRVLEDHLGLGRGVRRGLTGLGLVLAAGGLGSLVAARWAPALAPFLPLGATAPTIAANQLDVSELTEYALRSMGGQLLLAGGLVLLAVWVVTTTTARRTRAWLLLAATAVDLALLAWPFVTSVVRPDQVYADDLRRLAPLPPEGRIHLTDGNLLAGGPNVLLRARRLSTGGYDTFRLRDYDELMTAVAASAAPQTSWAALGVRHWVSPAPDLDPSRPEVWGVTELAHPAPRFYWTDRVEVVADRREALRRLPEINGDPRAVLLTPGQARRSPRQDPGVLAPAITVVSDRPGRQDVTLTTTSPGWLIKNEMFYPGWRADVDDTRRDVVRVNGIMQGIPLAAGTHRVSFVYAPRSLEYGLVAFAFGLALVLALFVWSRMPAPPGAEPETS